MKFTARYERQEFLVNFSISKNRTATNQTHHCRLVIIQRSHEAQHFSIGALLFIYQFCGLA